jgi:hypothetical protein
MAFVDGIDSFYQFVKARIQVLNTQRVVAGMLNAQDWPPKNVKLEAFYLLVLGEDVVGRQGFSPAVPIKFHLVQWTWIIKGSDLQQGEKLANRGDRYRIMQTMKEELTNGLFPNYAEKLTWSLNQTNGKWLGVPYAPKMFVTWTPVSFQEKFDKDSGVAYGTGSTRIQDILQPITS